MTIALWITLLATTIVLVGVGACAVRRSRFLDVNPRYRRTLTELGLTEIEHFLDLPSLIVSGHPNRNVARVRLGQGPSAIDGFLKREHRVLWRDYVSSFLAGFGPVSRSGREARMLDEVRRAGGHGPEVMAVGQNGRGQAFLLVRTLDGAAPLRDLLRQCRVSRPSERRSLARKLGRELARLHVAGFHHADLNSTHVFVDGNRDITFVDWQRSQRRQRVSWRDRTHDLAALDATLAEELASPRERLLALRSYLRATRLSPWHWPGIIGRIRRRSRALQHKRYVRELRSAPMPSGEQSLIWLDGEALCVTPEFARELGGQVPRWLLPLPPHPGLRDWVCRQQLPRARAPAGLLVQRLCDRPVRWLWDFLRGRRSTSPELAQAALLFRLQRFGIRVPRLLAVGQRHVQPWRTESFLLIEPLDGAIPLRDWLARARAGSFSAERKQVQRVLGEAGAVLRRLHEAGCYLDGASPLAVASDGTVAVSALDEVRVVRRARPIAAERDLAALARCVAGVTGRRANALRLLRGYHGNPPPTELRQRILRALAR